MTDSILTLEDRGTLDPLVAGAKAAGLARARQEGLPVLPGVVLAAAVSRSYLDMGMEMLERHGSGRARIAITSTGLAGDLSAAVARATAAFPFPMVVRSSSILEGSGEWSGAFTSYLDIREGELPKAILGCYASAYTQHTVERFAAAGVRPSSAPMAVLVQPALDPDFGGTARIRGDEVTITGVKGSPAPLVQGWDPGVQARVSDSVVRGDEAIGTLGEELLRRVAGLVLEARDRVGTNSCEWAIQDGTLWLLQVQIFADVDPGDGIEVPDSFTTPAVAQLGRLIRRHPGPLAEELVLPWAVADPSLADISVEPADVDPADAFQHAAEHASTLTAEVWASPKPQASGAARSLLRELRGPEPDTVIRRLAGLRPPDRERAVAVLASLATVRHELVALGAVTDPSLAWHVDAATTQAMLSGQVAPTLRGRIGFDRWDPLNAAIVTAHGASVSGTPVSNGIAFGRMCVVIKPGRAEHFRPRDIVVATHPVPGLAALLFDAAALVTTGGGPAAHLFESARALAIPAVCATRIEDLLGALLDQIDVEWALAVDGSRGSIHGVRW